MTKAFIAVIIFRTKKQNEQFSPSGQRTRRGKDFEKNRWGYNAPFGFSSFVCGASFVKEKVTALFLLFWRCLTIAKQELLINDEIREKEVRVIDSDGAQLGIISLKDALAIAAEKNLDLVEIAPTANPHVCRIMDYGKYKFEQMKREKEAKKNQKVIEVKEIRLSLNIDTNDFNTKLKQAIKFLKDGNKVKVSVRFRGREMAHPELGTEMVQRFADGAAEFGSVDKMPKLEGRSMVMIISSKTGK